MRAKDGMYDRLQTFVDERLLEVAGKISEKQRKEEEHEDNMDKLTDLKGQIEELIEENQHILTVKAQAEVYNDKLTQETDGLMAQVRGYRNKIQEMKMLWGQESNELYEELNYAKDSYNQTECEYQMHKQEIRIEMHEDATLIKTLEDSLSEADVISATLTDKARFSNKLETERQRMIQDRALLLKDL